MFLGPDDAEGQLRSITLADIGMEWNMSMDMTHQMEPDTVTELRTGRQAAWSGNATTDLGSLSSVDAILAESTTRVASFTFAGFG